MAQGRLLTFCLTMQCLRPLKYPSHNHLNFCHFSKSHHGNPFTCLPLNWAVNYQQIDLVPRPFGPQTNENQYHGLDQNSQHPLESIHYKKVFVESISKSLKKQEQRGGGGMEVEKTSSLDNRKHDDGAVLPGFRFHPTDDELVGFYLMRKVENKPISLELIKQVDIYKYDPWDLPRISTNMGDREWYFFCIRGRKYRNSIRPNRVTGSGFWKATGIDKPIYSVEETHECIGLKKSLVYYRGSAGKGTKTDWMMHEFRLPPGGKGTYFPNAKNATQEAEVWTLCRIFKRNPSYRKYMSEGKGSTSNRQVATDSSSKKCILESDNHNKYLSFTRTKSRTIVDSSINERSHLLVGQMNSFVSPYCTGPYSSYWSPNIGDDQFFTNGNWDELRSIVESAIDPSTSYMTVDRADRESCK